MSQRALHISATASQRIALCLVLMALAACREQTPPDVAAAAPVATAATPAATAPAAPAERPVPAFLSAFKPGMPYAELREAILTAGWLPLRDPACWDKPADNVGLCGALPEVENCDANEVCTLMFAVGDGNRLRIMADRNAARSAEGEEIASFSVRSWDLLAPESAAAAASCGPENFDDFLRNFATDDAARARHTAPFLELGELYIDADGNDASRTVYIAAEDYRDFDLRYRDGAYHHVDASGAVDPAPLQIQVETPSNNARLVRFAYGMSEGNSYRFEKRGDCWTLTGDPEPPSP